MYSTFWWSIYYYGLSKTYFLKRLNLLESSLQGCFNNAISILKTIVKCDWAELVGPIFMSHFITVLLLFQWGLHFIPEQEHYPEECLKLLPLLFLKKILQICLPKILNIYMLILILLMNSQGGFLNKICISIPQYLKILLIWEYLLHSPDVFFMVVLNSDFVLQVSLYLQKAATIPFVHQK